MVTRYDLVENHGASMTRSGASDGITMEAFLETEESLITKLSLEGARDHNSIRWVSYVDGHHHDNPYIDNRALMFLYKILKNSAGADVPDVQSVSLPKRSITQTVRLTLNRWLKQARGANVDVQCNACVAVCVLFVAILLYFVINSLTKSVI